MGKNDEQLLSTAIVHCCIASLTEPEGTFTDSAVFSGAEMFGSNGHQDLIINGSEVYGNVIAGNNAGDIHSDFLENTVRERSISAGDTEFLGRRWSKDRRIGSLRFWASVMGDI